MQHLPIDKDNMPEQFTVNYGGGAFVMRFDYNTEYDFFTCSLFKPTNDGTEPIILGEKLLLNKPLWSDFIPDITIGPVFIPMDLSGIEKEITHDNFGKSVFLYVDDDSVDIASVLEGVDI